MLNSFFSTGHIIGSSVQIPCKGTKFTFFILVQDHPEINEQWFGVHFVPTERFEQVGSIIVSMITLIYRVFLSLTSLSYLLLGKIVDLFGYHARVTIT